MRNNKFDTLPESGLSGLRQIDVRGNPLTSVPQALADLPKLEKLDLGWISNLSFRSGSTILRQEGVQCIGDSWKRAWSQMASPKQRIHNDLG